MISVCPHRHPNCVEPLVYSKLNGPQAVFLFDGRGSWGSGVEAAAWFRGQVAGKLVDPDNVTPSTIDRLLADLTECIPKQFAEDDLSWSFSLAVVIVDQSSIHVGAMGRISVVLLGDATIKRLFTPVRAIDELVSREAISAAEAESHQFRKMVLGPYFGDDGAGLLWSEHTGIGPSDRIVLGDEALPRFLEARTVPYDFRDVQHLRDEVERYGGMSEPTAVIDILSHASST